MEKIRLGGIFCHGFLHYNTPDRFRAWTSGQGPMPSPEVTPVCGDMWATMGCLSTGDVLVAPVLCQWAPRHKRAWNTLKERDWWVSGRVEMTNLKVKVDTGRAVWRSLNEIRRRGVIEYIRPSDVGRCLARFDDRERPFMAQLSQELADSLGESAAVVGKDLGVFLRVVRQTFIRRGQFDVAALSDEQLYHYFGFLYRRTR